MKKIAIVLLGLFFSHLLVHGKNDSIPGKFYFELYSTAFFDNLEFSNNIEKGYTLTGFNLEPRIKYLLDERYSISAGAHALFFSGEPAFHHIIPVLTLHTYLSDKVSLNIGTIDGRGRHGMPEPIFMPQREFLNQPETGMQFLFTGNYFEGETWINWEKFLFFGDTIQEEFTVGVTGNIKLLMDSDIQLSLPIYALAVHQGGQINVTESRVSTLANIAGGVNFSTVAGKGRIGVEALALVGKDLSPNPHHIYKNGWAVFPQVYYHLKSISLDLGYWKADSLLLPRGQQIFGSLSTVNPYHNSPSRDIVTANFGFSKNVAQGFSLTGKVQLYHVLTESQLDYRFAIIARFDEQFLLLRKRK